MFFDSLYNAIIRIINYVVDNLSLFLPVSPFRPFINQLESIPWIGIVNYFVPIGTMLDIMFAWVSALGLYYVYALILRWVKVVGE